AVHREAPLFFAEKSRPVPVGGERRLAERLFFWQRIEDFLKQRQTGGKSAAVGVVQGAVLHKVRRADARVAKEGTDDLMGLLDRWTVRNRQAGGPEFARIQKVDVEAQVDVWGLDSVQQLAGAELDALLP